MLTGRTRSVYQKLKISRICLRILGLSGWIPGYKKSNW
jgi:small subunit ribosomal protein S14